MPDWFDNSGPLGAAIACFHLKINKLTSVSDTDNKPDGQHRGKHGRAAITEEGKGYSCNRKQADAHSDIFKYLEDEHGCNTGIR